MPTPRDRRLQTDYEKVKALAEGSGGTLKIISVMGTPPSGYVIEYHCPSIVKLPGGKIDVRNDHRVEINLGSTYPFDSPSARMLTPVFNIHVFPNSAICLGSRWNPGETLDTLILRIGALLQYDPKVLDFSSSANYEAKEWAMNNKSKLPIGNVTFKAPQSGKSRIEWG